MGCLMLHSEHLPCPRYPASQGPLPGGGCPLPVLVLTLLTEDFLALCPRVFVPHPQICTETWAEKRCLPAQVAHPGAAARPCRPRVIEKAEEE